MMIAQKNQTKKNIFNIFFHGFKQVETQGLPCISMMIKLKPDGYYFTTLTALVVPSV